MPAEPAHLLRTLTRRAMLKTSAAALIAADAYWGPLALADELRIGAHAPPATLVTLDGSRISTTDLSGNVIILTFWATWCSPCRDELPLLSRYAAQNAAAGLRVLGFTLDTDDELSAVRKVAGSLSFPSGLLARSSAPGYGRIWRLPVNFTIDRRGQLADNGWESKQPAWTPERLDRIVSPLLESP
jgi:cytochrome c biogenesis protein CcmG, thiol:disulfide interchange protein DsbE